MHPLERLHLSGAHIGEIPCRPYIAGSGGQSIELIGPNQGNTSRPVVARLRAVIGHKLPADFLQLQPLGENKRNDSVIGKPAAEDFGRRGDQIVRGMAHLVQDFHPAHETGIEQDEIESEVVG